MKKRLNSTEILEAISQKDERSLITPYINFKQNNYEEPERKGTPKGDKIGFSITKFKASMLVGLMDLSLKRISKECDVSYGLLRKWNSEPDFKKEKENLCTEFASILMKYVNSEFRKSWLQYKDYFDCKTDKKTELVNLDKIEREGKLYSRSLLIKILELEGHQFEERERLFENGEIDSDEYLYSLTIKNRVVKFFGSSIGIEKIDLIDPVAMAKMVTQQIRRIITIKRNLSKKEQRTILGYLDIIAEEFLKDEKHDEKKP